VKELGRSKWSDDLDEEKTERTVGVKRNVNALSGLIRAYGKDAKSVRWADQVFIFS
jgi:YLP motif-containing protein 1